jgi:hypothetical protein
MIVPNNMKKFDFDYCAAPVTFEAFLCDYWQKEPLVIQRNNPGYFEGLFSIADIDAYLHTVRFDPQPGSILLANSKNPPASDKIYGQSGFPETHLVMNAFNDGDSVVLNRVQRYWLPLTEVCRTWESTFHCLMSLSVYLTPPNSQGFPPHFEGHEVCVMQLQGSKTWKIYPAEVESPLNSREVKRAEIGTTHKEVTLKAGDFLYLPRGCIHESVASGNTSLHLSVLIRIYSWLDLIKASLENASRTQKDLRLAITPGTLLEKSTGENIAAEFQRIIGDLPKWLDSEQALKTLGKRFLMEQQPLPDSRFTSLSLLDSLTLESSVFRHAGTLCSVSYDRETAEITFCRNFVKAPLSVLPAFEFIADKEEFAVNQLPDLSDHSKIVLVRRLIREGLLGIRPNT